MLSRIFGSEHSIRHVVHHYHDISERLTEDKTVHSLPTTSENWIATTYYSSLSEEKQTSIQELQNGTNWSVTLITAGLLLVITSNLFPSFTSLIVLCFVWVVSIHLLNRTLKGYINVVRWSLLQRTITQLKLGGSTSSDRTESENWERAFHIIEKYHLNWCLPLKRRDVIYKGLFELGYGYILVSIVAGIIFNTIAIGLSLYATLLIALTILISLVEIVIFLRSPYLRNVEFSENARRQR